MVKEFPLSCYLKCFGKGEPNLETIFNALTFLGNEVALFIISMIPLIELRGAVILGAALDMNWIVVLVVSVIGNMVPQNPRLVENHSLFFQNGPLV